MFVYWSPVGILMGLEMLCLQRERSGRTVCVRVRACVVLAVMNAGQNPERGTTLSQASVYKLRNNLCARGRVRVQKKNSDKFMHEKKKKAGERAQIFFFTSGSNVRHFLPFSGSICW